MHIGQICEGSEQELICKSAAWCVALIVLWGAMQAAKRKKKKKNNPKADPSGKPMNNDNAWYHRLRKLHLQHLSTKMMMIWIKTGWTDMPTWVWEISHGCKWRANINICWERENQFSSGMNSLLGYPIPNTSIHEQYKIYNNICNTYVKIIIKDCKSWIWEGGT